MSIFERQTALGLAFFNCVYIKTKKSNYYELR
jgi:hypothetical protein